VTYEWADLSVKELEEQAVIELPQRELLQRQQIVIILFSAFGGGGGGGGGGSEDGAGGNAGDGGNASVLRIEQLEAQVRVDFRMR
jgi:hypothetical protein